MGDFLRGNRDKVLPATKVGRYGVQDTDFSAERAVRSVEESLRRLKTDRIDLIQVHDLEYGRRQQIIGETIPALLRLRETGKVRFIGITGYPLVALKAVAEEAGIDTVLTYCRYNLLDTSMDQVLTETVVRRNIGLINASPLHMGALTQRGAPDWHPAPQPVLDAAGRAAALCRSHAVDIADLALRFALMHPRVAVTLVGMSKVRHVEANVTVLEQSFDDELVRELDEILAPVRNVCWQEGLPENDDPWAVPKRTLGLDHD